MLAVSQKRLAAAASAAVVVILLVANVRAAASTPSEPLTGVADYREVATWLKDHTAPNSTVLSRKPSTFYLWSGHKGVLFPFTADTQKISQAICDKEVDYVVQDSFSPVTEKYLVPAIAKRLGLRPRV
jgi:hypothetical protein